MADATQTPLAAPAATAPTSTTPATTTPASAAPAANAPDFAKDWNVAPEVGTWMGESGFKTPADFASAFMATKKLVGHDPANVIIKPKEGDSAARLAILKTLGAPEKPADYGLKLPEGGDPKFKEAAETWMHQAGIPKPEAAALYDAFNKYAAERNASQAEASEAARVAEYNAFREKVGNDYGRLEAEARAAAKQAELTPDEGLALEMGLGVERATTIMAKLGKHFVETAFKGGEAERGGQFNFTPEAARAQREMLMADPHFSRRWNLGDVDARKQIAALVSIEADGTPGPATANATPAFGNVPMQRPRTANY